MPDEVVYDCLRHRLAGAAIVEGGLRIGVQLECNPDFRWLRACGNFSLIQHGGWLTNWAADLY